MGAGHHGGFGNTYGAIAGDAVFKSEPKLYFSHISKRADVDRNGVYDVVAHGGQAIIQIESNGETIKVDSRIAANLIRRKTDYKRGQPIRLLSCNTGSTSFGFAQNLANKLGVVVEAPTKLVWALPNGRYFVAGRSPSDPESPDLTNLGKFKKFYPGGKRK